MLHCKNPWLITITALLGTLSLRQVVVHKPEESPEKYYNHGGLMENIQQTFVGPSEQTPGQGTVFNDSPISSGTSSQEDLIDWTTSSAESYLVLSREVLEHVNNDNTHHSNPEAHLKMSYKELSLQLERINKAISNAKLKRNVRVAEDICGAACGIFHIFCTNPFLGCLATVSFSHDASIPWTVEEAIEVLTNLRNANCNVLIEAGKVSSSSLQCKNKQS